MQDDGDEAAEARLTITSVRSTPPGYTGQRQANLMLKFEPADHPFIVKCGRLVGGGVDKDHLGAWYVPHFMMDGFCFYLATASNGQPLRDFDFLPTITVVPAVSWSPLALARVFCVSLPSRPG